MQNRGLTLLFAYFNIFLSAILFVFILLYLKIYLTVNVFPFFTCYTFASLQNLINVAWLHLSKIFLVFFTTFKLSKYIQIASACYAIKDFKTIFKLQIIVNTFVLYTSL